MREAMMLAEVGSHLSLLIQIQLPESATVYESAITVCMRRRLL